MDKILIAGDFCPQARVAHFFEKKKFEIVLGGVKEVVSGADYSIVNFECPVTYGGELPIEKCGMNLQCSEEGAEAVRWAGFDCVTLANNHFYDFGEKGVDSTLKALSKFGINTVGGGKNLREASEILFKDIAGEKLAIINCCEHEFSIATETSGGANPLNSIQQYYKIKEAKKTADYVLVIVHGGNEYYQLPSPRMKETYRFFIDAGADAVVNHHQHCFSGYEVYNEKPIFYGLGNFCFDEKNNYGRLWNEGFVVELGLQAKGVTFNLIPYLQCADSPSVKLLNQQESELLKEKIRELNAIIADETELQKRYSAFVEHSLSSVDFLFEPYSGRIAKGLYRRHLLPSIINDKRKLLLQGFIQCESHLPKIMKFLTNRKGDA